MSNTVHTIEDSQHLFAFLSGLPAFSSLPETELIRLCQHLAVEAHSKGTLLSVQGRTRLKKVIIIKDGVLEAFFDRDGQKTVREMLPKGSVLGGISILMNDGIGLRSVMVKEDAVLYVMSKTVFKDLCDRFDPFRAHFAEAFHRRMLDKSYAAMVQAARAFNFLSGVPPFSLLPEAELLNISYGIPRVSYSRDTPLFYQGETKVENLYIFQKGSAERYFEQDGVKTLRGTLGPGDTYGGISILINNGISVRTIQVGAGTSFYMVPKSQFLNLCQKYSAFADYFTDAFGKRMVDTTYASMVRKAALPQQETTAFFNQQVKNFCQSSLLSCSETTPIKDAAIKMSRKNCSSIFIKTADGDYIGLVTDNDLRRKVVALGRDARKPVSTIMSYPLYGISINATVSEALLKMIESNTKHLAVTGPEDKVIGVVTDRDLMAAQGQSPFFIIREISAATSRDEINTIQHRLPRLIQAMKNSGANSRVITKLISAISDAVLNRLISFAVSIVGSPPTEFAFLVMGSEGRREQTLKTDQDNAIIFADVPELELEAVQHYFLKLGDTVCEWLNEAGYAFCKGEVMAKNPKWCQPLSKWKEYFNSWIRVSTNKDLLQAAVFFDFRCGYGHVEMVDELRLYLFERLAGWSRFFRDLTLNALRFKPPLGFFRTFAVETKGVHRNKFNIKNAMVPIVDFARIYSLRYNIAEINTQDRLYRLYLEKMITPEVYEDMNQAFDHLMEHRLMCQIQDIDNGRPPDNYLNPKHLSRIEQALLKEIFKRIEGLQTLMKLEFTGGA
ncbi:MAG: DUF294 nucleotidyltransferase-like domain-containing protein [Desulfobacterales bacterium]|jgi:CBS domain-containing protein|nr:DUF294 nucleotidyltransferase-like domain-containing protein [Desulfobacterales bacterium]